ncbi:phosphatidylserine decarboxylase [Eubacteriales bacterium OttesenSCG-928-G02]|nr:phosphatidylserine decarboxylase [Eubacteriales bacterium OttesenSCG-928-G02]
MNEAKKRDGTIVAPQAEQEELLSELYGTKRGKAILKIAVNPVVSKLAGKLMDTKASAGYIEEFIQENNIDMSEFEEREYTSYNDFFTRRLKKGVRTLDRDPNALVSPCDARLSFYKIDDNSVFHIKGGEYTIESLLQSKRLADEFSGGICLIFRLCVDDYHRYCFFDDGIKSKSKFIEGKLHTVNPIALEHENIYKTNSRECTVLITENFGKAVQIEVGAMMVGKIKNHNIKYFKRGIEKGYFEFGGSTIVLLLQKDIAKIHDDIIENTNNGYETIVKMGERIGEKL